MAGFLPDNTISIGTSIIPINGPVQVTQATTTAPKITIGDTTRASNTLADEWTISDNRAGLLIKYMDEQTNTGRFFWSTSATWTPRRLHLPPLVTSLGKPEGVTDDLGGMWEYAGAIYASFAGHIFKLDPTNDTWGTELQDVGADPTDGVVYKASLYLALGDSYWDLTGSTWTEHAGPTDNFTYFTAFDVHPSNKLMGITATGTIRASIDGSNWTEEIGGEVLDVVPKRLLAYRNPVDEPAVFVATTTGLVAVDPFTKTNAPTSLQVLAESTNGLGSMVWTDGNLYYPNGLSLWRYPKSGQINNVGLDREDGLPTFVRGRITTLTSTPNYLVVGVDVTTIPTIAEDTLAVSGEYVYDAAALAAAEAAGPSTLFLYTGSGWHTLYQASTDSTGISSVLFTSTYGSGERRLFFAEGDVLKYVVLPEGNYDPTQDGLARFAESSEYITGWFDSGYEEIPKLAASLNFRARGLSATEWIKVDYGLDEEEGWTPLGNVDASTVDASGHVRLPFILEDNLPARGLVFYSIRFRFTLYRAPGVANAGKTPYVIFSNLVYKRMHNALFAFTFQCSAQDVGELRGMWETVLNYKRSNLLQPFIYRNQDVEEETYVVILSVSAIRHGGGAAGSTFTVTCSELEN